MEGLCNSRSKSRSNRKTFKDIWDSPFDQMLPYLCDLSSQHLLDMVCLRTEKSNIKKEVEEADFWFFFSDEICSVSSDAQENQSKLKAYCIQFFHARKRKRENAILPIFFSLRISFSNFQDMGRILQILPTTTTTITFFRLRVHVIWYLLEIEAFLNVEWGRTQQRLRSSK